MKNINMQQILYFRITMKCSSFAQAAELAYTTQSTISKNIASLEKIVGEPLFIRQKKGIIPTPKAIFLNLELSEVYDRLDSLFNSSYQYKQDGITVSFCQNIDFPSAIPDFFSLLARDDFFSRANVKLHCYENETVVNGVLNGSYDLGFILSDTNVSNPNIKLHTIASAAPQIFFSINSPLNQKENLTIHDFSNYPLVTTRYLIEKNDYRMINQLPFTPKGIEIVESYDDIPIYLATGHYITLLRPCVYLSNHKNIVSYNLSDTYPMTQGVTMIWFQNNKNKYLKKILTIMGAK
ncbi:MAG TPA: LysR family transcriptional regulator [Candidatus Ventrimonas merdavium]|nr:LysR family transcriptional regulator [Candidatus Ventrimonas merdavium]